MVVGLHHLIVSSWNYPRLRAFLTRRIEREVASSWFELAQRLPRLGHWEFRD